MLLDHRGDYPSQWAVITTIATKAGINHET